MTITIEEVKTFLKTTEGETFLEELNQPLTTKNGEIIGRNKTLKKELEDALAKVLAFEEERELGENDKMKKTGDLESLEKRLNVKHEQALRTLQDDRDRLQSTLTSKTIDDGLTTALLANNIAKQHIPAIKALLKSEAKIETSIDEEGIKALVNGRDLGEYVKTWADGSVGKLYIAADKNSGGGANGSSGKADGFSEISKLSAIQKMDAGRAKQT